LETHANDSLLEDETLTNADIARSATASQAPAAALDHNSDVLNRTDQRESQPNLLPPANTNSIADAGPLFPDDDLQTFRARWVQVQTSFVDEPHHAVEQADSLVANVVKRIAEQFSAERAKLEDQWGKGDNVSTEDLRQALRRYRSLFDRLLSF
jgi:hypothetical protein